MLIPRVASRALIIHKDKLLLVNSSLNKGNNTWCTPGGGINSGEDLQSGLEREIFEETGLKIDVHDLSVVSEYLNRSDSFHQIDMFFKATIKGGTISEDWSDKHGVVQKRGFFSLDEIQEMYITPSFLKEGFWLHDDQTSPVYKGTEEKKDA